MPRSAGSRHRVRPDRRSTWACPPTAGAAPTFATSPLYRPRRPAETPLYRVVQHHLNTFLARAEADEIHPGPYWTEREFRQYLICGILAYSFARARCGDCHQEPLVAFSCRAGCRRWLRQGGFTGPHWSIFASSVPEPHISSAFPERLR